MYDHQIYIVNNKAIKINIRFPNFSMGYNRQSIIAHTYDGT